MSDEATTTEATEAEAPQENTEATEAEATEGQELQPEGQDGDGEPGASADEKDEDKSEDDGEGRLSHDDALEALEKVRKESANYRRKLRDLEKELSKRKTPEEVEELATALKSEREAAERSLIVENVALKFGLPDELSAVLQGDTREELEKHATTLSKFAPQSVSHDDARGGLDPNDALGDGIDASEEARMAVRANRR